MDDNLIAFVGVICLFGLPVAGWITVRVLEHQERMAMLQRGIVPPPRRLRGRWAGRWDAPAPGYQAAPGPMPVPPGGGYVEDPSSPQCTLRRGIVTAAVGIALFIGLSFIGYRSGDGLMQPPSWHPGPWLLGGLIPMFVGFAQIGIALMSGAQFTFAQSAGMPSSAPPPSSPFPRYGPPPPPPEPGRAGPRYEELARPVPPPDRPNGR